MVMNKKILTAIALSFLTAVCGFSKNRADVLDVAEAVAKKGERYVAIEDYKGSVYIQGLAEMYLESSDRYFKKSVCGILDSFVSGEIVSKGNFISYHKGGNALVEMAAAGYEKYRMPALGTADKMWKEQNRNRDGLMMPEWDYVKEKNSFFIDVVLTVVPYFLHSGLLSANQEYVDYAAYAIKYAYETLLDSTGLLNQAIGCRRQKEGEKTQDCWSRGNGWFSLAMVQLMRHLPETHKDYAAIRSIAKEFYLAVLKYRNDEGLWNQEMTWPDSYTEISGSALLLYGIGSAIEEGVLPDTFKADYLRSLKSLLTYVSEDGDVGHTCSGCLAYRNGTKEDYASHLYYTNDAHAFGPVLLCLAQTLRNGIRKVDLEKPLGHAIREKLPSCHVRYIGERKGDIAWENDFCTYRIYSQQVKSKVSSGVDYWGKYVDYPVIEKWYERNGKGLDYHTDRGEGWDFYAVGRSRGTGGTGVYSDGRLYVAEPYSDYKIYSDSRELIDFELTYLPYKAGEETIYETKRIRMVLGTHFYEVTSTIRTESGKDAVLAVGITDFGNASVERNEQKAMLSLDENISEKDGNIGCAVFASPDDLAGFAKDGKDELLLLKVKSGTPVRYYVGTGWSKDLRFDPYRSKWPGIIKKATYSSLNEIYN